MIPVQVRVTKKLMDRIDDLIKSGMYSNRSEAIRDAIRKNVNGFDEVYFQRKNQFQDAESRNRRF